MKVYCIFSSHYLPYLGGVERYTYNLANTLKKKGDKVIIVTSHMNGQPNRQIIDGIEIIRTDAISFMNDRLPFFCFNKNNFHVLRYLKKQHIDRVIINTKFYLLSYVAASFAKNNKIPAIVVEHGTGHIYFSNFFTRKIGEIYEHLMAYFLQKKCSNFVGVSNECCNWLKHFGIVAKGILYNSINYDEIQELLKDKIKNNENEELIIAYSGRLIKEKGIYDVAFSYKKLKTVYPRLKLIIIGNGPEYSSIYDMFRNDDGVTLTGKLDYSEVIKKLSDATIFCFPSVYPEGLPTCVLEAMAVGVIVIATPQGGTKEVINEDKFGIIINDYSRDKLTATLNNVIAMNKDDRNRIALNGKNRVKSFFTWDNTVSEMEKIFKEI